MSNRINVGVTHPDYLLGMSKNPYPSIEVKIRKGLPEGERVGTPNISYKELEIDGSYIEGNLYTLFEKEKLWNKWFSEYNQNLEKAKKNLNVSEFPTDGFGVLKDISWVWERVNKNEKIYVGGCFFDRCLYTTITTILARFEYKNLSKEIFVIPEIALCYNQPAQVSFAETFDELNRLSGNKIKIAHLDDILNFSKESKNQILAN